MADEVESVPIWHVCIACRSLYGWGPDQEWTPLCPDCSGKPENSR